MLSFSFHGFLGLYIPKNDEISGAGDLTSTTTDSSMPSTP
jgi:hypothetical protein